MGRLTVLRHGSNQWQVSGDETITTVDRLKDWLRHGALESHLFRYDEARLLTHRLESIGRPLKLGLMLRVLSRGPCYVEDERGHRRLLSMPLLARWGWQALCEPLQKRPLLGRIGREVGALERRFAGGRRPRLDLRASPLYLRADMGVGITAGGSVGHIAGVLNHLAEFTGPPVMLTTDVVPTVDRGLLPMVFCCRAPSSTRFTAARTSSSRFQRSSIAASAQRSSCDGKSARCTDAT